MRKLVLLFVLIASPAHAQSDATFAIAVGQLAGIMSGHMTALDHAVVTFHYEFKRDFQPRTLDEVKRRVVGWPENFFNVDKIVDVSQGPGTYVSIDPAGSRIFGETAPQLTVFTLKVGTRVFATGAPITTDERETIQKISNSNQCDHPDVEVPGLERMIQIFRTSTVEVCRRLIIEAARRVKLQAILYDYPASNELRGCRDREEAFNIVSSDAFDVERVAFYEHGLSLEGRPMQSYLARLYPEAMREFGVRWNTSPGLNQSPLTATEPAPYPFYRHWKRHHLYKCGATSSVERADDRFDLWTFLRPAFRDRTLADLLVALKMAFLAHAPNADARFEIMNIESIGRAQASAFGFGANTRSQAAFWAFDLAARGALVSPIGLDVFRSLVGEAGVYHDDTAIWRDARAWAQQLKSNDRFRPNALYVYYRQSGYGPKLARYAMNQHLVQDLGAAPYLISAPNENFGGDEIEAYRKNSEYFRRQLARCLEIYQTPGITFQEIQSGDCAVRQ